MHHERKQPPPRFRSNSRCYRILENLSAGDLLIGFLFSGTSTRLMYKVAHTRAKERYMNRLAIERLEASGYVRRKERRGTPVFFTTKEGKRILRQMYEQSSDAVVHPKKWDGVWRLVAYDFPEKDRSTRNSLRHVLSKVHFLHIQKSVWIFPYDCSSLSELLAKNSTVRTYTVFMKVTDISSEDAYKKYFKLV